MSRAPCDAGFLLSGLSPCGLQLCFTNKDRNTSHNSWFRSWALERSLFGSLFFFWRDFSEEWGQIGCEAVFPEDRSGTISTVYVWKSHGINFEIVLFWEQRKLANKQLDAWERRLSSPWRDIYSKEKFPFFYKILNWLVEPSFGRWCFFGYDCKERPILIF